MSFISNIINRVVAPVLGITGAVFGGPVGAAFGGAIGGLASQLIHSMVGSIMRCDPAFRCCRLSDLARGLGAR